MKESLITFETAKLAKEKEYNIPSDTRFYYKDFHTGWVSSNHGAVLCNNKEEGTICRPTQSLLQDWLLEKHGYFVTVELAYNEWGRYAANVEKQAKDGKTAIIALDGFTIYDNPYDALEEGLQEALKLI